MAGDIEAFLKMAAERRRKAMEAEGKSAPAQPQQPQQQQPQRPTYQTPQQPYRPKQQSARPAPPPPRPANVPYNQPRPAAPANRQSSNYQPSRSTPVGGHRIYDDDVELVEAEPVDDYYQTDTKSRLAHDLISSEVSSDDISSHAEHLDDGWANSLTDDEEVKVKKNLAKDLVKMLSNPDSITKAIVLNEILRRPDFD